MRLVLTVKIISKNPSKYEIKVDENTTNSSSKDECINKLKRATEGTSTRPLLIQFLERKCQRRVLNTVIFKLRVSHI